MTDPSNTPRPRPQPRRRRPNALPVAAGSLAAFFGLFGFMAYQLRTGHDPALGNQTALATTADGKRVIVKRIENRVIVTRIVPASGEGGDDGGGTPVAAIPSQSAPVVIQQAPAPASAAPAPAPAPVVTRTS